MSREIISDEADGKTLDHKDSAFLFEQYSVLANDRIHHDELFWNVPMTFLTAQAFLLVIALGGFNTKPWQCAIGAFISFVFGILTIQIFERNRVLEIADAELLLDMERHFLSKGYKGSELHHKNAKKKYLSGNSVEQYLESKNIYKFLNRGVSYELWKKGMWLVTAISLFLFLYNLLFYFHYTNFIFGSFADFIADLDRNAISNIMILMAVNWLVYLVVSINPKKLAVSAKENKLLQIWGVLFEGLFILGAATWEIISYPTLPFPMLWFYVSFLCLGILGAYLYIVFHSNVTNNNTNKLQVVALLMAGGRNIRLKSIKQEIVKFRDVITPERNSLLENSFKRNRTIAREQIIITVAENSSYISSAFRDNKLDEKEKSSTGFVLAEYDNNENGNIKVINETKSRDEKSEGETHKEAESTKKESNKKNCGTSSDKKCKTKKIDGKLKIPVLIEPCTRGTATAIYYYIWKSHLYDPSKPENDPILIISPTDHLISEVDQYSHTISKVCGLAKEFTNIYLLGVVPTYISNQYGYIQVNNVASSVLKVEKFIEKPEYQQAKSLQEDGFVLWNTGIFIARFSVILNAFRDNWKYYHKFPSCYSDCVDLSQIYNDISESSFDRDVLEYVDNLYAVRVMFDWIDVGDPVRLQSAIYEEKCSIQQQAKK
jgi:mannose-1-phosphate guanylyltransferase